MKAVSILETVLYAGDIGAAERFYIEVLGLEKVGRLRDRHVFLRCGSQVLLIFNPAETSKPAAPDALPVPTHGAHGSGHVCFAASATEVEEWREHLVRAGVGIEADFEWPQGGRSIYFRDPAGNSVEFAEPRIWKL